MPRQDVSLDFLYLVMADLFRTSYVNFPIFKYFAFVLKNRLFFKCSNNLNRQLLLGAFRACEPYLVYVYSADEVVNRFVICHRFPVFFLSIQLIFVFGRFLESILSFRVMILLHKHQHWVNYIDYKYNCLRFFKMQNHFKYTWFQQQSNNQIIGNVRRVELSPTVVIIARRRSSCYSRYVCFWGLAYQGFFFLAFVKIADFQFRCE
jgi:hypothetical protein